MNLSMRYTHTHALLEQKIFDLYAGSLKTRTDITLHGLKIAEEEGQCWDDIELAMRAFRTKADTTDIEFFDGPIKILLPDEYKSLYNKIRAKITEELGLSRPVYTSYMIQLLWYLVYIKRIAEKDKENQRTRYYPINNELTSVDAPKDMSLLSDLQAIETFASLLQSNNIEDKALALDIKNKLKEWR